MKLLILIAPNLLTMARLLLGLALPWVPADWRLAAVLFAGLSDLVDGAFSRWLGATSYLGRILDPIADKVFVLAVIVVLLAEGSLPPVEAVLVALRDVAVMMGALAGVCLRRWELFRRLAPTLLGKMTTAAQFVFLLVLLLPEQPGRQPALILAAVLSGLAALDYLRQFARLLRASA